MNGNKTRFPLHYQILTALILAFLFGYFFPNYTSYTSWMGTIFIRGLNMVVIPLILCSIITGVASISNSKQLGKLTLKTMGLYISTSLIAILTGFTFVYLLKPGAGFEITGDINTANINNVPDSLGNTLINIVPKNIFEAISSGNMMAIIFFAILFGFFITRCEEKTQATLKNFFSAMLDVIMQITLFIIKLAPLGIFGIISGEIARHVQQGHDIVLLLQKLLIFMLVVILGIVFHGALTMSILLKFLGRVNPLKHFRNMAAPLLTAFSTSSSNATLPLTMEAVEKNNGVSPRIAGFTIPLGATINMDGTSLYECVVVIFIAQVYGIDLSFTQYFIVIFTALLTAIGAAGIPMASLVMMVIILKSVGLPVEGIALILPVDRILDMFRTSLNVYGDTCVATIIAKSEGETLNV